MQITYKPAQNINDSILEIILEHTCKGNVATYYCCLTS